METMYALTVNDILPGFLDYLTAERRCSPDTRRTYEYNIGWFIRTVGDRPVAEITLRHVILLKSRFAARDVGAARLASIVSALKSLLAYARDILNIPVLDLSTVRAPRPPRRDVVYLTDTELEQFLEAIPLRTVDGRLRLVGYRFRALVETLVATGMRLGETLALDRTSVDFTGRRAKIIGKGDQERAVFFTGRAIQWLFRYLDLRIDQGPALFATENGTRLGAKAVQHMFQRTARRAGLAKRVTPHILRHTMATTLLKNGCPIGYIKALLGHRELETTCRYYLGVLTNEETEKAHRAYLDFEPEPTLTPDLPEPPDPWPNPYGLPRRRMMPLRRQPG